MEKNATQECSQSHEGAHYFEAAFELVSAGMAIVSREGQVSQANQRLCEMLGYSKAELLKMAWQEVSAEEDLDQSLQLLSRLLAGEIEGFEREKRFIRKNSSEFWGHLKVKLVRAEEDLPSFLVCLVEDITERKQVEQYLIESEKRYRSLFENMNAGFVLFEVVQDDQEAAVDLVILAANERFEKTTGLKAKAVTGKRLKQVLPGIVEDTFDWIGTYGKVALTGEPLQFEQGSELLKVFYSVTAYQAGPKQCGVTFHEITDRKLSELALENREKQLSFVLQGSELGFWDWNIAAGKVERNEQWALMLGYTHSEIEQTAKQWTDFIYPDDRERAWSSINAVLEGHANVHRIEYRMLRKDGGIRWILDQASVMQRDPDGKPLRMCGTHTDITERKQNELELEQHRHHLEELVKLRTVELAAAKDAAEAASRAKSTFLSNMSHELRTPMNAIMGMTNLALRQTTDPQLRNKLTKIDDASHHLLSTINDILDISKIEAEHLELEQRNFKLGEVIENIKSLISHKAEEKGLKLRIDLAPELARLSFIGDPLRLGQVLLNFAGNAVKFTERGSVTVHVRITEETPENDLLRFDIRDTGIGIAAEDQQRLFTAFEQADGSTTRKYGGTGLGLAISKRLAYLMGGTVGVESAEGQGSTFWFTVRLGKSLATPTPESSSSQDTAEARLKASFLGTRILLAEDEPINQEVSRGLLEEVGFEVDIAENGAVAVALAQQTLYPLILMDVQMPSLNGVDATRAIRVLPGYAEIPILAMTANAFDEDRQVCIEAGMNDHIGKPIDPGKLFETILKWLSKQ